jgi:hypothetical protein
LGGIILAQIFSRVMFMKFLYILGEFPNKPVKQLRGTWPGNGDYRGIYLPHTPINL